MTALFDALALLPFSASLLDARLCLFYPDREPHDARADAERDCVLAAQVLAPFGRPCAPPEVVGVGDGTVCEQPYTLTALAAV